MVSIPYLPDSELITRLQRPFQTLFLPAICRVDVLTSASCHRGCRWLALSRSARSVAVSTSYTFRSDLLIDYSLVTIVIVRCIVKDLFVLSNSDLGA